MTVACYTYEGSTHRQPGCKGEPVPEDPARLQGPEVGAFMLYGPRPSGITVDGVRQPDHPAIVVRVIRRSYVWAPEQHHLAGQYTPPGLAGYHGFRHYDWSVIEHGPGEYRAVVVNDTDLHPLPEVSHWGQPPVPAAVHTVYTLQREVAAEGGEE